MYATIGLTVAVLISVASCSAFDITKFSNDALTTHNALRAKHNSPALSLSTTLNTYAQSRAANLAHIDAGLSHAGLHPGYGENLFGIFGHAPTGAEASNDWYNEIHKYNFNNPGFGQDTGHFTQLVWKSSSQVGFGVAQGKSGWWYVSAIYYVAGNVVSQGNSYFKTNVLPLHK